MKELFTTPRIEEFRDVKKVLRENNICYYASEEIREYGQRYCLYVEELILDDAVILVDERLTEIEMERCGG